MLDWFALSLLCAFSLATADAFTKKKLTGYTARELVLVRFGATALILLPLLGLQPWPELPLAFWGWLAMLLPLEILAMLLYVLAIRDSPLSLTLPYLAFTPVFTTFTGFIVLGEKVTGQGFFGILLVVAGSYLLNVPSNLRAYRWTRPFVAMLQERGSRLMLGVAALYSLTSVLGKLMLVYVEPAFFGPFYFVVLGAVTLCWFWLQEPRILTALWRRPGWSTMVGLCTALMIVTHFLAIEQIEVAYMIAVKRTSLLFGIVYGALWFGERRIPQSLAAGSIMVAGVYLLLL